MFFITIEDGSIGTARFILPDIDAIKKNKAIRKR
jgi:hypothetical protein